MKKAAEFKAMRNLESQWSEVLDKQERHYLLVLVLVLVIVVVFI